MCLKTLNPWEGQLKGRDLLRPSPSAGSQGLMMSETRFPNSRDPGRDVLINTAHIELSS